MKRGLKYTAAVPVVVLVGIALVVLYGPFVESRLARRRAIRLLSAAQSPHAFREAVGPLGITLSFPDDEWLAIRYEDSHSLPGWSKAVAVDSKGAWFESEEHFCGVFKIYAIMKEKERKLREAAAKEGLSHLPTEGPSSGRSADVQQLAESPDLGAARRRLGEMGFRRLE